MRMIYTTCRPYKALKRNKIIKKELNNYTTNFPNLQS